jgi:hypothetical protein
VWWDDVMVAKSRGFRAHEISGITDLVKSHQAMFTEKWHEYFS